MESCLEAPAGRPAAPTLPATPSSPPKKAGVFWLGPSHQQTAAQRQSAQVVQPLCGCPSPPKGLWDDTLHSPSSPRHLQGRALAALRLQPLSTRAGSAKSHPTCWAGPMQPLAQDPAPETLTSTPPGVPSACDTSWKRHDHLPLRAQSSPSPRLAPASWAHPHPPPPCTCLCSISAMVSGGPGVPGQALRVLSLAMGLCLPCQPPEHSARGASGTLS